MIKYDLSVCLLETLWFTKPPNYDEQRIKIFYIRVIFRLYYVLQYSFDFIRKLSGVQSLG